MCMHIPDALVQSAEFCHQLCSSFILITAQIMNSLDGFRGGLQFILIDIYTLVLKEKWKTYTMQYDKNVQAIVVIILFLINIDFCGFVLSFFCTHCAK